MVWPGQGGLVRVAGRGAGLHRRTRRSLQRGLVGLQHRLGLRTHGGQPTEVPVVAVCVYRQRNAQRVADLLRGLPHGTDVRLHYLDPDEGETHLLRPWTVSSGPGPRMRLLQDLLDSSPRESRAFVLLFDDDVCFTTTSSGDFVGLAAAAALDISQPAHAPGSVATFDLTRQVPLSTARMTTFVEVGPVVLLSPRAQAELLPFPEEYHMGWGLDVVWTRAAARGLRLGIVDATPVTHVGPVGSEYAVGVEHDMLRVALESVGASSIQALTRNSGRPWRPWQEDPPWLRR